jgi:hypothetical protein
MGRIRQRDEQAQQHRHRIDRRKSPQQSSVSRVAYSEQAISAGMMAGNNRHPGDEQDLDWQQY